jgi:serine/threonine-protein kinase RsbW
MSEPPTVRVALRNSPENVALIRAILSGLADTVSFGSALDDVKAAVSEACNNVVVHAYEGGAGPLEVEFRLLPGELVVAVRDHGVGIHERADPVEPVGRATAGGLGLPVMEALADRLELSGRGELGGTEAVLHFVLPGLSSRVAAADMPPDLDALESQRSVIRVAMSPASLGRPILVRLMSAAAARANFSIDRLSDEQLVADALTADHSAIRGSRGICFGIEVSVRRVELELGPVESGGSHAVVASQAAVGLGSVVETLTDEIRVRETSDGEMLAVVILDT